MSGRDGYGAIVFDLDGVLVDSEGIGFEALRALLATHGVDYRVEDNEPFIGINDRDHFTALKEQHVGVDELHLRSSSLPMISSSSSAAASLPALSRETPSRRPIGRVYG